MSSQLLATTSLGAGFLTPVAPPTQVIRSNRYEVRFAQTREEIWAVQQLRFEIFNLELGQGLDTSYETGRDEDKFDPTCHHLMVFDKEKGQIAGTYRLQTIEMASSGKGLYSTTHFDLSTIPVEVMENAVEVGRACIAREYRSLHVLHLLWSGLGMYLQYQKKKYLFGSTALRSKDPLMGLRVYHYLVEKDYLHATVCVQPHPELLCNAPETTTIVPAKRADVPPLMRAYLNRGAKICSPPARDLEFGTIDYFTLIDVENLDPEILSHFHYRP